MEVREFPQDEIDSALSIYGTTCTNYARYRPSWTTLEALALTLRRLRYSKPMLPVADFVIEKVDEDVACLLGGTGMGTHWEESRWEYFFSDGILWEADPHYRGPTCGLQLLRFFGLLFEAMRNVSGGVCLQLRPDLALSMALDLMPESTDCEFQYKYTKSGKALITNTEKFSKALRTVVPDYESEDTSLQITRVEQMLEWNDANPYRWPRKKSKKSRAGEKRTDGK